MFVTREMTRHLVQTKKLKCAYARCCNTGKTRRHSLETDLECRQVQAKVCIRCINRASMFVTREMTRHTLQHKELRCEMFVTREMTRHTLHTKKLKFASARCCNTGKTRWHNLEHDLEWRQVQAKVCVRCINRVSMFVTLEMTSHIVQTKKLKCAYARCWNTGKTRWHSLEHDLECRQVQVKVCVRCINRVSMFVTREILRFT
jgi:ribosomal protein L40E